MCSGDLGTLSFIAKTAEKFTLLRGARQVPAKAQIVTLPRRFVCRQKRWGARGNQDHLSQQACLGIVGFQANFVWAYTIVMLQLRRLVLLLTQLFSALTRTSGAVICGT